MCVTLSWLCAGCRCRVLTHAPDIALDPLCVIFVHLADTLKHFGCELGAQTNFDKKTGTSIVNGAHDAKKLSEVLEIFIKKYVQCYNCGNPETVVKVRKECIFLKCKACGNTSDVDMRDKLTTFIVKNPPENKLSKSEAKVKKDEKERMKAAEKEAKRAEKLEAKEKKKKEKRYISHDLKTRWSSSQSAFSAWVLLRWACYRLFICPEDDRSLFMQQGRIQDQV